MKVTIDGIGELRFSFKHHINRDRTTCKCELDREKHFSAGSFLADGDQFRKDKGRRVSLARLLRHGLNKLTPGNPIMWQVIHKFTREQRTQIWAAYFQAHSDLKGGK